MVKHLPHISIEKYAAYLDGNLPDEEMQQMKAFIDTDADMQAVLEADSIIGGNLDLLENEPIPYDMDLDSIELPSLDNGLIFERNDFINDFFSLGSDRFFDEAESIIDVINPNSIMAKNDNTEFRTFGEQGENLYDPNHTLQPDDHSCALRAQQIILRDYGIDIPFKDLEKLALEAGVYSEHGTYPHDMGKVLEMAGVGMHRTEGNTIYDLTNELSQGHRVMVSVDADELWYTDKLSDRLKNWFNDVVGNQGGNHALIVAGVEVNQNNPFDVKVVLTDSGSGHLRIEYPWNQFYDAWKDSNCLMVATDIPAPYQYDAVTGMEVPSNFAAHYSYNQFIIDNGYQLKPESINIPDDYQPYYEGYLTTGEDSYNGVDYNNDIFGEDSFLANTHDNHSDLDIGTDLDYFADNQDAVDDSDSFISEMDVFETSSSEEWMTNIDEQSHISSEALNDVNDFIDNNNQDGEAFDDDGFSNGLDNPLFN